ncbi:thiamine pyrophosphate-binding protein [Streptomyces iconiensis]|uniref:Thiamine pyrophosphate-binding protein n=1 Tax=Streptomyces iconiensis TaxID=1384038 RepID=A0ABT6ZYT2_9ACTN|nr:thiamine pyrophosphate-binding protein [Streptomyces iconiensis]MDJ1134226.1 thiamine pyrophosphate-binding protein [Streptomyces iconiensis]
MRRTACNTASTLDAALETLMHQSVINAFQQHGVKALFGIPGGAILPLYQRMSEALGIQHILTRHEQGAGHAASGYAQASGRVGVCVATSGPGATNLVTALMDSRMDSVPTLAITGQVPSGLLGSDAFQESDICSITAPVTKFNAQVSKAEDVGPTVARALRAAVSGRPGPVLVDITKDALQGATYLELSQDLRLPHEPRPTPDPADIRCTWACPACMAP